MKNIILKIGKLIGLTVLAIWGLWTGINTLAALSDKLHDEITVYGAYCSEPETDYFRCSEAGGHLIPERRMFKVNFDRQFVIKRGYVGADKYTECSVYDTYNWYCQISEDDKFAVFSMKDGTFSHPWDVSINGRLGLKWLQSDRTLYLLLSIRNWLRMIGL